jgi:hypothetical protein
MKTTKSSVSKASSYVEMGKYWDSHDVTDIWDETREAQFEFNADPQITYFAVEKSLSEKLRRLAAQHGISADTLLSMWVQEKMSAASETSR